jgi:2-methylaconitate cis-trans-isomerase PrpF
VDQDTPHVGQGDDTQINGLRHGSAGRTSVIRMCEPDELRQADVRFLLLEFVFGSLRISISRNSVDATSSLSLWHQANCGDNIPGAVSDLAYLVEQGASI